MNRTDIEFAHIYADQLFGDEQRQSAEVTVELLTNLPYGTTTSVLIDDYNVDGTSFNTPAFTSALAGAGVRPSTICYESSLVPTAIELLGHLNDGRLRRSHQRYANSRGRYACSLLTAAWYLTRLGYLMPIQPAVHDGLWVVGTPATDLINVLPSHFAEVEATALDILSRSEYSLVVPRITTRLFDLETPVESVLTLRDEMQALGV
jgi:hypothetical protein